MSSTHAPFTFAFVYAALAVTLTAGFGLAAALGASSGFGLPLGVWWFPLVQAHGHAQLWGWTGLFIIGVSLYFVPRLVGVPLWNARLSLWICWLLAAGILLRTATQPLAAVYPEGVVNTLLRCGLGMSAVAEVAAVGMYVAVMLLTMRSVGALKDPEIFQPFRLYMMAMLAGWLASTLLSDFTALYGAVANAYVLDMHLVALDNRLYLGLVLLPVTMIFSIRTFPLYLRLPKPRWPVQTVGMLYLCGFGLECIPSLLQNDPDGLRALSVLGGGGQMLKGGVLLWFIWALDVLLRWKPAWTVERVEQAARHVRKQPRPHLPDYGEFGRFERLLYSACVWLAVGGGMDVVNGIARVGSWHAPVHDDALRHVYLMGFASLLLLGMAPRMIPGFIHRRAPAYPALVDATFWLGNLAAACRIVPAAIPPETLEQMPVTATVFDAAFGVSGFLGWAAALALTWNLIATRARESPMPAA